MKGYTTKNKITYTEDFKKITEVDGTVLGCLTIKDGVEIIGNKACEYGNFSEVVFPSSLKLIGRDAFYNSKFKYIEINKNIELSPHAFEACDDLYSAIIKTEYIPKYCFAECNLSHYINFVLENTKEIGAFAFHSNHIENFLLPNTLRKIENNAFYCTTFKDTTLFLPEGLEYIGRQAFSLSNLTNIYLPRTIKSVDSTVLDSNTVFHIYEESINQLGKLFCSAKNVKVITLEELLKTHTFKEINDNKIKFKER